MRGLITIGRVYGFIPNTGAIDSALAQVVASTQGSTSLPAILPVPSQTPVSEDFANVNPQIIPLSDDLRWTEHSPSGDNSRCQHILGALPVNHPWLLIARSLKMTLFGSLITGRYGNAMRVVKLWPYRHQFITQCFLEALLRIGFSYQDCQNIDCECHFHCL